MNTPTYDQVHLKYCLTNAVRSAVENLRDDPSVSQFNFHRILSGDTHEGFTLYALAYSYLETELVNCTCAAEPDPVTVKRKDPNPRVEDGTYVRVFVRDLEVGDIDPWGAVVVKVQPYHDGYLSTRVDWIRGTVPSTFYRDPGATVLIMPRKDKS